jgi:hypothetical protein
MRKPIVYLAVLSLAILGVAGALALRLRPERSARESGESSHAPAVQVALETVGEVPGKMALLAVWLGNWPFERSTSPFRPGMEHFDRIRDGMTRDEVCAVVGPPGDYSSGPLMDAASLIACNGGPRDAEDYRPPSTDTATGEIVERVEWRTDNAIASVFFRPTGEVRDKYLSAVWRIGQSPVENLLWRAKRQWRRWFS